MIGMFPVKWNQGSAAGLGLSLVPLSNAVIPLVRASSGDQRGRRDSRDQTSRTCDHRGWAWVDILSIGKFQMPIGGRKHQIQDFYPCKERKGSCEQQWGESNFVGFSDIWMQFWRFLKEYLPMMRLSHRPGGINGECFRSLLILTASAWSEQSAQQMPASVPIVKISQVLIFFAAFIASPLLS